MFLDFGTGEILHVDYGVCFGKGMALRVPEVVPFRLTPTLRCALGLGREGGVFRRTCESTLSVLAQKGELITGLIAGYMDRDGTGKNAEKAPSFCKEKIYADDSTDRKSNKAGAPLSSDTYPVPAGKWDASGLLMNSWEPDVASNMHQTSPVSGKVSQQIASLIAAATSLDNLACMYEGWASWI